MIKSKNIVYNEIYNNIKNIIMIINVNDFKII